MILEHYSAKPLKWPPRNYRQSHHVPGWGWPPKPRGLWVSVKGDCDWKWWCEGAGFRPEALANCTRIRLTDSANLKIVSGEHQLIDFDNQYGVDWGLELENASFSMRRIDWERLAKEYDGLIIAPYVWSCRLGDFGTNRGRISDWYYPWDCASGCIWNGKKAIRAFENMIIEEEQAA